VSDEHLQLPSPAEVRCTVGLDLPLIAHGLSELSGRRDDEIRALLRQVLEMHAHALVRKLTGLVPPEVLRKIARRDEVDIFDLTEQLPFVRLIWLLESSYAAVDMAELIANFSADEAMSEP